MAPMPINDRLLIKQVMLVGFSSASCEGVNAVHFSNDHNIVSSLICGCQNKLSMELLDPFLQISKINLGLGGRRSKLLQKNEILLSLFIKIFDPKYLKH